MYHDAGNKSSPGGLTRRDRILLRLAELAAKTQQRWPDELAAMLFQALVVAFVRWADGGRR